MVKWRLGFLFVFIIILFEINAQNYPQNYFRYPLDSLPNLVSPFGGLRDNHFHSGMDLRTNQREGFPVFASADGYISRIKIQSIGYGKAIYIDHPNGYTTVYGHLQKYSGKIAEWIHNYQYKNQTFEFDYVFEKPILLVKKGDTIGLSGNSGGSSGPHVHFEIRNTKSEKIINPTLFGIIPFDTINPTIKKVFIYKFVSDGLLLKKEVKIDYFQIIKVKENGNVFIYKTPIELDADLYGFGIETYDYIHNLEDEKGIYEYSLKHKDKLVFKHTLNQFAFGESKYINAHIDYPFYKAEKYRIQKCFLDDGNEFSTYETNNEKGKIYFPEKSIDTLVFEVIDNNKNSFKVYVPIKVLNKKIDIQKVAYLKTLKEKKIFYPLAKNSKVTKDFSFEFEEKSFYDTIYYEFDILPKRHNAFSKTYKIFNTTAPIHKAAEISIKPTKVNSNLKSKLLLAYYFTDEKNYKSAGGNFDGGVVKGKASSFGHYFITIDTVAPIIKQIFLNTEEAINDSLHYYFEIKDNFSGIGKYEGFLNDEWILLDFDAKSNILTYHFDEIWKNQITLNKDSKLKNTAIIKPEVLIRVIDKKGNVAEKLFEMPITF
ncbi:MAG: M23 family metallopeptidase [Bacteroidia bacterium]|nr:M23 family metallopeptidase [Bacteroidia bacterium]